MALTVTSLGTAQDKTNNYIDFTYASGLVLTAGDFLLVMFAGSSSYTFLPKPAMRLYDSSAARWWVVPVLIGMSGTPYTMIGLYKIPFTTASGDYLRVYDDVFTPGAGAITVYKVTGIGGGLTDEALAGYDGGTGSHAISLREGMCVYHLMPGTITSLQAKLIKTGTPTGNVYARIRRASDDALIGTLGEKVASTLSTSLTWVTFNTTPVSITAEDTYYILIECDSITGLSIGYGSYGADSFQRHWTTYNGSVYNDASSYVEYGRSIMNIYGAYCDRAIDAYAGTYGSSATPTSGSSPVTTVTDELALGSIAINGPSGDTPGSWTTGAGYVYGNEQRLGTTGGKADTNFTVTSAVRIVSEKRSFIAAKTGMTSRPWVDIVVTLKKGVTPVSSSFHAYIKGIIYDFRGSQPAYIDYVERPDPAVTSLVLMLPTYFPGGVEANDSFPAFMFGTGDDLVPDADITSGSWMNATGGSALFPSLADDSNATYVYYYNAPIGASFEVSLTNPEKPVVAGGQHFEWTANIGAGSIVTAKCELVQGSTVIASDTQTFTNSITTYIRQLTSAEIANITDYTDLRFRITVL